MPETVVITGASAGVGRATAQLFGRRRAKVGLIARGRDGLEAAKREIETAGGEAIVLPLDVSDADAVEQAAAVVERTFGPIDIWVNNAMLRPVGVLRGEARHAGLPRLAVRSELIHDGSRVRVVMVNMPALNTPQFRWVKSRLPRKAQPVPPIFQPEVAANAIVWAAYSGRREINVGLPTSMAVIGNNFVPGLGDYYLARHGYDAQMIDEAEDPHRPDNLWAPLPGDAGAHGVFDDRSRPVSIELELNKRRGWLAAGAAFAAFSFFWWKRKR